MSRADLVMIVQLFFVCVAGAGTVALLLMGLAWAVSHG